MVGWDLGRVEAWVSHSNQQVLARTQQSLHSCYRVQGTLHRCKELESQGTQYAPRISGHREAHTHCIEEDTGHMEGKELVVAQHLHFCLCLHFSWPVCSQASQEDSDHLVCSYFSAY